VKAGPVMWRCPKCGEQNEDQFDSCWKCAKAGPVEGEQPARQRESRWFFRYWRRGWAILLLAVLVGLCARFALYVLRASDDYSSKLTGGELGGYALRPLALALVLVALPVSAYLVFTLLFGEEAWTWGKLARTPSREETASALFEEGATLERCGKLPDARDAYAEVVQDYPETPAAQNARKRLENLRAPIL
jgi:hypothetical protein